MKNWFSVLRKPDMLCDLFWLISKMRLSSSLNEKPRCAPNWHLYLCVFGCSNKRKTGSKSNIIYYRIPFGTDPESLSLRKRWIAAIRRENWTDDQIDNSRICSKHFISGKSKKTLMVSISLVFLFVSVTF